MYISDGTVFFEPSFLKSQAQKKTKNWRNNTLLERFGKYSDLTHF